MYIRRKGGNYYVQYRFPDGSLTVGKSTGTPNYVEAQKIAMREYSTGEYKRYANSKLKSNKTETTEMLQWKKFLKTMDFEKEDVQEIVDILIQRKLLVSCVVTSSQESELVIPYLLEFWDYDNSPYRKERARLGKELSYTYFETAFGRIKKYWVPRLEGKYIGDITSDDIAQMISYIHVMDARLGDFVYPSKDDNKSGANWIIRPFANITAELKTKPFLIPQNADDYLGFKSKMQDEENMLINSIL